LIESSNRHENDLLEAINSERERMVRSIKKQKSFFDTVLGEQEVIMDDAVKKEKDIRSDYGQDRERSLVAVEQLHTQFKTLHAAERERKLKQNNSNIHHHSMDFYKNSNTNNSVAGSDRGGASSVNGSIATATSNNLRRSPATDITSNVSNKNVFNSTNTMQDEPVTKIQSPIFTTPRPQQNRQPSLSPPVGMKTPPHLSRQHPASSQQHKKEQQHAYQSPHSVMQTIPQQSSTSASVHNNSPQPPPPLHYASSAFNQPHYHPNNQPPMQSSSYQQQQYHPQSTPPPQPIAKTSPTSRSLIVRTPLVEESSSNEKGFEIMNVREETPPFEMVTPPSTTRRQQVNDFHFNTSRKVPIIPSATATTSSSNYNNIYEDNNEDDDEDDDDDESAVTPGPVRSGQLLRFLEDRADHEQKYHVIDNNDDTSPSNSSRHYHPKATRNPYNNRLHSSSQSANMRSIALADNTDDYSQASSSSSSSSPSSVTGYAYRTTTRTRNTVLTKTTSLSNNGDNSNNNIGAATTSTTNTGDIGEF